MIVENVEVTEAENGEVVVSAKVTAVAVAEVDTLVAAEVLAAREDVKEAMLVADLKISLAEAAKTGVQALVRKEKAAVAATEDADLKSLITLI